MAILKSLEQRLENLMYEHRPQTGVTTPEELSVKIPPVDRPGTSVKEILHLDYRLLPEFAKKISPHVLDDEMPPMLQAVLVMREQIAAKKLALSSEGFFPEERPEGEPPRPNDEPTTILITRPYSREEVRVIKQARVRVPGQEDLRISRTVEGKLYTYAIFSPKGEILYGGNWESGTEDGLQPLSAKEVTELKKFGKGDLVHGILGFADLTPRQGAKDLVTELSTEGVSSDQFTVEAFASRADVLETPANNRRSLAS